MVYLRMNNFDNNTSEEFSGMTVEKKDNTITVPKRQLTEEKQVRGMNVM